MPKKLTKKLPPRRKPVRPAVEEVLQSNGCCDTASDSAGETPAQAYQRGRRYTEEQYESRRDLSRQAFINAHVHRLGKVLQKLQDLPDGARVLSNILDITIIHVTNAVNNYEEKRAKLRAMYQDQLQVQTQIDLAELTIGV